jgi:hypothetical protein
MNVRLAAGRTAVVEGSLETVEDTSRLLGELCYIGVGEEGRRRRRRSGRTPGRFDALLAGEDDGAPST